MRSRTRWVPGVVLLAAVVAVGAGRLPAGADATGAVRPRFADDWATSGSGDGNLQNPRGVAVNDNTGDVYMADTGNDRIVQYDADGRFVRTFGTAPVNGLPLDNPWDVAVNANGWIYVADTANHRIVRYTSPLAGGTAWGSQGGGNDRFRGPKGIGIGTGGDVYVADTGNDKIKTYDAFGVFQDKFGASGSGNGQLSGPRDVAASLGGVYVADTGNDRISRFDFFGNSVGTFGSSGSANRQFESPQGVYTQGNLPTTTSVFVADTGNDRISVWSATGTFERKFGTTGSLTGRMEAPRGIFVDEANRRLVADTGNDRLELFDPPVTEGITGRVTDVVSGAGLEGAHVTVSDATTLDLVATARADADGEYQVAVPPGSYAVAFFDPTGSYEFEYFDDRPDVTAFDPVAVTAATVAGADAALTPRLISPVTSPGDIAGDLTEAGLPAAGTWVLAIDAAGFPVRTVRADPTGHYRVQGLQAGNYTLLFLDPRGVNATEFHDDTPDPTFATPVVVQQGTTAHANADLAP